MVSWLKQLFGDKPGNRRPASDSPVEIESDLLEAEAGVRDLVDYLLSDRLFWQLSVSTPLGERRPKMTLGSLHERITGLKAVVGVGPNDAGRLAAVETAWNEARRRFPAQFTAKLNRELDSYLKNWTYYLEQRRSDPERWQEEYEVEVRNRTRTLAVLQLLGPDAPPGLLDELKEIEARPDED